jgi:hypothetical protein
MFAYALIPVVFTGWTLLTADEQIVLEPRNAIMECLRLVSECAAWEPDHF